MNGWTPSDAAATTTATTTTSATAMTATTATEAINASTAAETPQNRSDFCCPRGEAKVCVQNDSKVYGKNCTTYQAASKELIFVLSFLNLVWLRC